MIIVEDCYLCRHADVCKHKDLAESLGESEIFNGSVLCTNLSKRKGAPETVEKERVLHVCPMPRKIEASDLLGTAEWLATELDAVNSQEMLLKNARNIRARIKLEIARG